jgi:LysM repeat protein
VYIIQPDELVSAIALRYGVTLAQIQAVNPGLDLNFPGDNTPLIIPPPQATPGALPQPTAVPLTILEPTCYSAADGAALCLALAQNNNAVPVSFITGQFVVQSGGASLPQPFSALLDTLPAGASIPLYAYFPAPFPYPFTVSAAIQTAVQNSQTSPPVLSVLVDSVEISSDGIGARISGKVTSTTALPAAVAVVAAGYSGSLPASIRRIELSPPAGAAELPFTIWVYSAGPAMDRVEVFSEPFQ